MRLPITVRCCHCGEVGRLHRVNPLALQLNDLRWFSASLQPAFFLCRRLYWLVAGAPHLSRRVFEHVGRLFGAKLVH